MNPGENMEEQYLDLMIKLAFEMEEKEEVQEVLNTPPSSLNADEQPTERALDAAFRRMDQECAQQTRRHVTGFLHKAVTAVFQAAACIALMAVIAGPIALAQSATFRSKVMELLIRIDADQGTVRFSFEEVEGASFDVPADWTGRYFLSYVPGDFSVYRYAQETQSIEYRDSAMRSITFSELDENTVAIHGSDGTIITYADVNGRTACVIEGTGYGDVPFVSVTWSDDANWFCVVTYGMDKEETLKIANGGRMIKQ